MKNLAALLVLCVLSKVQCDVLHNPGTFGEPLQIVKFVNESSEINIKLLNDLLSHNEVKNREIVVVSIIGATRSAKSFFMNYCLRFMYANYKSLNYLDNPLKTPTEWIGSADEPLKGFSWKKGTVPDTDGLVVWSDVFLHTAEDGKKLAIILADTQGLFRERTSELQTSLIFAIGTLMSSIQIYNLNRIINENQLKHLKMATDFAVEAAQDSDNQSNAFQSLVFLVRDWINADEHRYGLEGGNEYLKHVMEVDNYQSSDVRTVREKIFSSYDNISCFLMPQPDSNIMTKIDYDGRWSLMNDDYKKHMMDVIFSLLNPKGLKVKKIGGKSLTAREFKYYMEAYLKSFGATKSNSEASKSKYFYQTTIDTQMMIFLEDFEDFFVTLSIIYEDFTNPNFESKLSEFEAFVIEFGLLKLKVVRMPGSQANQERFREDFLQLIVKRYSEWKTNMIVKYGAYQAEITDNNANLDTYEKLRREIIVSIHLYFQKMKNEADCSKRLEILEQLMAKFGELEETNSKIKELNIFLMKIFKNKSHNSSTNAIKKYNSFNKQMETEIIALRLQLPKCTLVESKNPVTVKPEAKIVDDGELVRLRRDLQNANKKIVELQSQLNATYQDAARQCETRLSDCKTKTVLLENNLVNIQHQIIECGKNLTLADQKVNACTESQRLIKIELEKDIVDQKSKCDESLRSAADQKLKACSGDTSIILDLKNNITILTNQKNQSDEGLRLCNKNFSTCNGEKDALMKSLEKANLDLENSQKSLKECENKTEHNSCSDEVNHLRSTNDYFLSEEFEKFGPTNIGGKKKMFYISRTKHLSWDNAALYCKERGMNLATFNSYNEALYYDGSSKYSSWVGVRDKKQNGEFLRITDDKNIKTFIPWRNSKLSTTEFCVHAWDDFSFSSIGCDVNFRFGCETVLPANDQECKELIPPLMKTNKKLLAEVFTSFSSVSGQNKTFYISISKYLDWAAAFKYCEDRDMNLATFNSLEEATFFNSKVKYTVWVGVRDYQRDGNFLRVTDLKNIRDFLPWRQEQPSGKEFCVHASGLDKFNNWSCDGLWRFACEAYN